MTQSIVNKDMNPFSIIEKESSTKNRHFNAANTTYAAATNSETWLASENVTEVTITCTAATAGALQGDEYLRVVFDAPNTSVASAWLADTGTRAVYEKVYPGQTRRFTFTDYILEVDVLPVGDNMNVVIGAQ